MKKILSGLKTIIKLLLYRLIDFLLPVPGKIRPNTLLLVRLDEIGDYVLFRNFIEMLKRSEKYKNYSVTLVGNMAWKDLSEKLDGKFIDKFIWIDKKKFDKNLLYRYKKLKEIRSNGHEVVIAPVYSRDFFYNDSIVRIVNAKEKIGNSGNLANMKKWQKILGDKYYTKLIPSRDEVMFEFYRNREFFENLLEEKLNINGPFIDPPDDESIIRVKGKYAVIFIGAKVTKKRWSIKNFVEIAKHLKDKYQYEIVLSGGSDVLRDASLFMELFPVIDLVGKTSLLELVNILYYADLVLSNDSSAIHIAAALQTPRIFVIYGGIHYGRFVPYPKEITDKFHIIYHPYIENNLESYKKISNSYGYDKILNINEITVDMVKKKIDQILSSQQRG
ncbi:MAG: glycosyltransferase family 9 protein [Candidatus Calescibacterium sp.]|nr:glycosyltransferase family 9 protein [Candidatus Calescibacterium sp.]